MNVVTLPPRERRPTEVKSSPADIVAHPSTPDAFVHEALHKMREDAREREEREEADLVMGIVRRNFALETAKAISIANQHGRQAEAIQILEIQLAHMREVFR